MSISNDNRIAGPFTGTGAIVPYAFTFKVFQNSDVVATVTDLTGSESTWVETTNYNLALNPDQEVSPGGTLTPTAGLTTGYKLTLTSAVANLQPVVLTNAGAFLPAVINTALDRLTILVQQLAAKLAYSITFPYSDGAVNGRLPTKALRANTTLGFDANGDMIVGAASSVTVSAAMTPVVQAASLSAGRTAFGVDPAVTSLLTAAPALADVVGFSDVSAADAMKKTTLGDVLGLTSALTAVAPALTDVVGFSDVSDSNLMKKTTLGDVLGLTSALTTAPPALTDVVGFSDVSDSNLMKKTTIAGVLALGATSGTWTPTLSFTTPGNLTVAYSTRSGTYLDTGQFVVITFNITVSTFTHTTATGNLVLSGLPFAALTSANNDYIGSMYFGGYTKATHTMVTPRISSGASAIDFTASGSGQAPIALATTEVLTGAGVNMAGTIIYRRA